MFLDHYQTTTDHFQTTIYHYYQTTSISLLGNRYEFKKVCANLCTFHNSAPVCIVKCVMKKQRNAATQQFGSPVTRRLFHQELRLSQASLPRDSKVANNLKAFSAKVPKVLQNVSQDNVTKVETTVLLDIGKSWIFSNHGHCQIMHIKHIKQHIPP